MPKIKWCKPPNMVKALFSEAQKAQGMTSDELGELLGVTGSAVRSHYHRGTWKATELKAWAHALNIRPEELGKAIMY